MMIKVSCLMKRQIECVRMLASIFHVSNRVDCIGHKKNTIDVIKNKI